MSEDRLEQQAAWEPPSTAGSILARWDEKCRLCGKRVRPGDRIWIRGQQRWFCTPCRWPEARTTTPTWGDVLTKIHHRIELGLPTSLDRYELAQLADRIATTGLEPVRVGPEHLWSARGELPADTSWLDPVPERANDLGEYYGLVLDSIEHRFSPNLRTPWVQELLAHVRAHERAERVVFTLPPDPDDLAGLS